MIDYIAGSVAELAPAVCVIDCGGVGYEINITLIDYAALADSDSCKLYVHEAIREDSHILYGFLSKESRMLFRLLIGVSGVGPNTARLILSSLTPEQLEETIATGNDTMLKAVKGIGGKTAQRIIVDLKDKINIREKTLSSSIATATESYGDALQALIMLGFQQQSARKALQKVCAASPAITTEEAIKQALKML